MIARALMILGNDPFANLETKQLFRAASVIVRSGMYLRILDCEKVTNTK